MSHSLAVRVRNLSRVAYVAIGLSIIAGDQATKALVVSAVPEHTVIPIIPEFLNLTHVKNAGAAFGLFADSPSAWKTWLLIVVSAALLVTVVALAWRARPLRWEAGVGVALIAGGAFSNLVDRIRLGRVVDFVDVYVRSYHWPAFNLADSAITVGAGFLILQVLLSE